MNKLDVLSHYINEQLAPSNLTLSDYGRIKIKKQWKLPEE